MSALKICPQCGTEYELDQRFCPKDGSTLKTQGGGTGDLVGSIIADRYSVLRKLGEGGMGTVYLAEHVKMGRKSAVKVMNPGMVNDADAISRFNREAANASRINHANVAAVYDFGETADGLIYLAMEFIEGPSLTKEIEDAGSLPPLRAADITRQASEALAVAHDMGIVHRDLKPDNIMLAKGREDTDIVKVVDFGIAKAAKEESQKVTKTGMVVGTPEYMSPEQLSGDKLDGRSDTYSLALVAFNMLTGKLPFPAETAQESMIARLMERPKQLAEMKPDVAWTAEVQAVMDRALERDVALRYQTAAEFGRELYQAVQAMPESQETSAHTAVMAPVMSTPKTAMSPKTPGAAVPPTRVASATPAKGPAAAVAAPAKSRTPMYAGIGAAAVVIVAVGGYLAMKGGGSNASADPGTTGAPVQLSQTVATQPVSLSGAFEKIEPLTDLLKNADSTSARRAFQMLDSIAPLAQSDSDKVHIELLRAEANFVLEKTQTGCSILKDNEGKASRTRFRDRAAALLKAC